MLTALTWRDKFMTTIQKQSRHVRILFQCIFASLPFMICFYWFSVKTPYDFLSLLGIVQLGASIELITALPLSPTTRLLATLASLGLSAVLMCALNILINLFRQYESGTIFSLANAIAYQKLSFCVFYWVAGSIVYHSLMSVILSFNNPAGERILSISFSGMEP
jgi:hypothetical protein